MTTCETATQEPATTQPGPNVSKLPDDALLTRRQVALVSGFALPTLKAWAACGRGPRITRIEGLPRYRVADVRSWLAGE